jgi:hypothetical protein
VRRGILEEAVAWCRGRCVKGILTDALPRHFREEREAEAADRGWCLQRGIRKRLWLLSGLAGTLFDARSGEKIPDCTPEKH